MTTAALTRGAVLVAICTVVAAAISVQAQAPRAKTPSRTFEVASVKRNTSGSLVVDHSIPPGRYAGTNLSVEDMLAAIYAPLARSHMSGGPDWIRTERFDIVATTQGSPSPTEVFEMLHSLLIERFKFAAHMEAREGDVYNLVLARSDRRPGPRLRPSTMDCVPQRGSAACPFSNYAGRLIGTSVPMWTLAGMLVVWVEGRDVRDRTGLPGPYDMELTWTPTSLRPLPPNAPDEVVRAREAIDPNGPSIFAAIQEQLGLKLESVKDSVEVLVIDRIEHPAED